MTLYKIEDILKGGQLDDLIEALIADDEATKLAEAI
jgi:peptide chain release factor 1